MGTSFHKTDSWRASLAGVEGALHIEPTPRSYRVFTENEQGKETLLMQSKAAYLVWESTARSPSLAFSAKDVKWAEKGEDKAGLIESENKGNSALASKYYDLITFDRKRTAAVAWSYDDSTPTKTSPLLQGLDIPTPSQIITLSTSKFSSVWEEGAQVLDHIKNPYHRVDAVPSLRSVQVYAIAKGSGKEYLLVDSGKSKGATVALFETGLPTRWYFPADAWQVHGQGQAQLRPPPDRTSTQDYPTDGLQTTCPYKGIARYHSVTLPGESKDDVLEKVAWSYPEALPDLDLTGLICLWVPGNDRLKLVVDGEHITG